MHPYCEQYLALKVKKKMSVFCREQGLDYNVFRAAKAQYLRKKSSHKTRFEMAPLLITSEPHLSSTLSNPAVNTQNLPLLNTTIQYTNGVLITLPTADISTIAQLINLHSL